jgi:regulator of sigma E protease
MKIWMKRCRIITIGKEGLDTSGGRFTYLWVAIICGFGGSARIRPLCDGPPQRRRNGVVVEEFGIGFPPKIWSRKTKSGYVFSINWLPLGGFVKLKGEHDADETKGSFGAASVWSKTKILLAGVVMNLLAAFVLLTIIAVVGMPQLVANQFTVKTDTKTTEAKVLVGYVEPNSPAASLKLKSAYQLVGIGLSPNKLTPVTSAGGLPKITKSYAGDKVYIRYDYSGQQYTKQVTLRSAKVVNASLNTKNPLGYLGIDPTQYSLQKSTWSAPIIALGIMKQFTILTFKGIWSAISSLAHGQAGKAGSQVAGPVRIVQLLNDFSQLGYQFVLMIIAVISLSLALINVLPIPALDGGRLFFTLLPRLILRRPLRQRTEELIHGSGMAVIFLLFILITVSEL